MFSPEQPARADAGVVEQQVDFAERGHRRVRQRLHVFGARHIGAQADDRHALRLEFGDRHIECIFLHIGKHQLHAQRGTDPGEFLTETGRTAGDHRHLALELLHIVSSGRCLLI